MLTKDLLLYRVRKGSLRPSFVDARDPGLLELAQALIDLTSASVGIEKRSIDEALGVLTSGHKKPKVAKGLAKLLLDRMDFGEAGEEAPGLRAQTFPAASALMRSLSEDATFEDFDRLLSSAFGDLSVLRTGLFADLQELRPLVSWRKLDRAGLLDRYNLALAQGLMLYTERLTVDVEKPDLRQIRRLLSWLKCCRLVADLSRDGDRWTLVVEGPAAILAMQKKYGLELANFLGAIPILSKFQVTASVRPPKRGEAELVLTQKDPLTSFLKTAPGHIPEEIKRFVADFSDDGWSLDSTPAVKPVGVSDVAVMDFVLKRPDVAIGVELFHRWHRHALVRRLDALAEKPDPSLVIGVDRRLVDDKISHRIEASPQVFLFSDFPSKRALKEILERHS